MIEWNRHVKGSRIIRRDKGISFPTLMEAVHLEGDVTVERRRDCARIKAMSNWEKQRRLEHPRRRLPGSPFFHVEDTTVAKEVRKCEAQHQRCFMQLDLEETYIELRGIIIPADGEL